MLHFESEIHILATVSSDVAWSLIDVQWRFGRKRCSHIRCWTQGKKVPSGSKRQTQTDRQTDRRIDRKTSERRCSPLLFSFSTSSLTSKREAKISSEKTEIYTKLQRVKFQNDVPNEANSSETQSIAWELKIFLQREFDYTCDNK
jgi:hypothetical protein